MIPQWKTYIYKFIQPCSRAFFSSPNIRGTHWGVVLPYHSRSAALGVTGEVWGHAWRDENLNSKGPPTCWKSWGNDVFATTMTKWVTLGGVPISFYLSSYLVHSYEVKMYKNFQCKAWHLKRFTSLVEFIWSINTSQRQMLSLEPWPFADPFAPGPCKTIEWHRVR